MDHLETGTRKVLHRMEHVQYDIVSGFIPLLRGGSLNWLDRTRKIAHSLTLVLDLFHG